MFTPRAAPATDTFPSTGIAVQPEMFPMRYGYVPLDCWKETVAPVELFELPFTSTDQEVPGGNPVSVKLTA